MTIYRKHKNVIPKYIKNYYTYEESLIEKQKIGNCYMGIIYVIINNVNNKIYIGKDKHNNPKYYGSGKRIKYAIRKYGKENFSKFIIDVTPQNDKELGKLETQYINPHLGKDYCYNIGDGGENNDNFTHNPNKENIRKKFKEIKSQISDETRQKMSASGKTKIFTKLHRKHISEANKNKKKPIGFGEKISKANKGKRIGKNNPYYGKSPSKETRKILSNKSKLFWENNREWMCLRLKGKKKSEQGKKNMRKPHKISLTTKHTLLLNSIKSQIKHKISKLVNLGFSDGAAKLSAQLYGKNLCKKLNVNFDELKTWIQTL